MSAKEQLRQSLSRRYHELWPQEGPAGRPPLFPGQGRAAERLRRRPEYRTAQVVLVMADPVLLQVRVNALADRKMLIAATPGLKQGLVRLSPDQVPVARRSQEMRGGSLFKAGTPLRFPRAELKRVDLMVVAALAADKQGRLLGDGRGLGDLTYALLERLGALGPRSRVAVLLDDEQMVEELSQDPWDLAADLLITPGRALVVDQPHRPQAGLEDLPPRLAGLPLVKALRGLGPTS